jgi:hypothetical protein
MRVYRNCRRYVLLPGYNNVVGVLIGSLVVSVTCTVQSDVLHVSDITGGQGIIRKLAQTVSKLINVN